MTTKFIRTAAIAFAAALAGAPAISQAVTTQPATPVQTTYQTTLEPLTGLGAPWTGSLQIAIHSDGIIQGYYHPAGDEIAFVPVTGGRNGDNVWLDIGRSGHLHVQGILKNGVITGTAVDESSDQGYDFTARVSG